MKQFILILCAALALSSLPPSFQAQTANQRSGQLNATSTDCSTANSCLTLNLGSTDSTASIQLSGTFTATATFEATAAGGAWASINGTPWTGGSSTSTATAAGGWAFDVSGKAAIRVRISAYTSGGITSAIASSTAKTSAANASVADQTVDLVKVGSNTVITAGVNGLLAVGGGAASAAALSGNPVLVAAASGANTATLQMNITDSGLKVDLVGAGGASGIPLAVKGPAADGAASNNPFAIGVEAAGNVTNIVDAPSYQGNAQVSGSRLVPAAIYGKDINSGYSVPNAAPTGVATIATTTTALVVDSVGYGVFNTTLPALTTGQVAQVQLTSSSAVVVTQAPDVNGQTALSSAMTSTLGATVFNISSGPGNLYGYEAYNNAATACWIQVFKVPSASVNLGTTVADMVIGLATITGRNFISPFGILNSTTGFSAASTTTAAGSTTCGTVSTATFFYK